MGETRFTLQGAPNDRQTIKRKTRNFYKKKDEITPTRGVLEAESPSEKSGGRSGEHQDIPVRRPDKQLVRTADEKFCKP